MPFVIGALAALVVGTATLGSSSGATVAFVIVASGVYLLLPVLVLNFVDVWLLAMAFLVLGGGTALLVQRQQARGSRQRRASMLTMAAPVVLAILATASLASTWILFRARTYAALIGPVTTVPFAQTIQRLDTTVHPVASDRTVIDQETVRLVDADVDLRRA